MTITCIAAVSIDGKIARNNAHFTDWTSAEDKRVLTEVLDASDVIVVGRNTFKIASQPLSKRNCIVFTRSVQSRQRIRDSLTFCNPEKDDIRNLLERYANVAVLGGTQVYSWFLKRGLVDTLLLTIEPIIFGYGLPLFDVPGMGDAQQWHMHSCSRLNEHGSLLLEYRPPITRSSSV